MGGTRSKRVKLGALAAGLAFALYLPSARYGFIRYDDPLYVTANQHVLHGLSVEGLRWSLTATDGGNWHPLTWWSHMFAVQLFGTWAGGHHLVNALLHAASAGALFGVVSGLTGALLPSLAVAALFATHPLHVESVAWISERKDVLSAFFWMLTLGAWTAFLRRPRPGRYLAALGIFALSLMAKPMAMTLPLVLLTLDFWPLHRLRADRKGSLSRLVLEKVPFLLPAAAVAVVSVAAQNDVGALGRMAGLPPDFRTALAGMRASNAVVAYVAYLGKALFPTGLAVFYPHPAHTLSGWTAALAVLLLAGVTAAAVLLRRRAPWIATGWAWYLVVLAPVIGLVQVGAQGRADRYTYVPLIGIWCAVVWSARRAVLGRPVARRAAVAVAVVAIVALSLVTIRQLGYWRDTETLFRRALTVTVDNYQAHGALGEELRRQGRFAEAEGQFRAALASAPRSSGAHDRLGRVLFDQGRISEAAAAYRQAVRIDRRSVEALNNLGVALTALGELPDAESSLREAVRLAPGTAEIWSNLGDALARQGRTAEAAEAYGRALLLNPGLPLVRARLERLKEGGERHQ